MSDRNSVIASLLGRPYKSLPVDNPIYPTYKDNPSSTYKNDGDTGNYVLKVFYFLFFYLFLIFLVLLFVHYTITPVFRFSPGGKGYISIPGNGDDLVYWNNRQQPVPFSAVPSPGDKLSSATFINAFSFSIDLYITELTSNSNTRLILYKTSKQGPLAPPTKLNGSNGPITLDDFIGYMGNNSSMIMYVTQTNDIMITFFSGSAGTAYSIPYIKNVPIYTPFRITMVVEPKMFTVYFNNKQMYERLISQTLLSNSLNPSMAENQTFYSYPDWANTPSQTVFVQNFHLWPRTITYKEILNAQPALALASDFAVPQKTSTGSTCTG